MRFNARLGSGRAGNVLPGVPRKRSALAVVGEHSLVRAIQFARFEEKRTTGKSPFRLVVWVA